MTRGDLVTIAMPGDFGKPRPAVIIQSDRFAETGMVTILLMSGTLVDAPLLRPTVQPSPTNGLRKPASARRSAASMTPPCCRSPAPSPSFSAWRDGPRRLRRDQARKARLG